MHSQQYTPRPIFNGQFELHSILGEGSTSKVYKARVIKETLNDHYKLHLDSTTKYVAIKVFKESYISENYPKSLQIVESEVEIMSNLRHQNIVSIHGSGTDGTVVKPSGRTVQDLTYIVMEYIKGDLLFDFVKDFGGIGEDKAKAIMSQMVNVLTYMRTMNVAHRDIKLENIMVTDQLQVKVADFGFAKQDNCHRLKSYRGTKTYMAPEIKEGKRYDGHQVDIFSTGVVLFSVVSGIFPFNEATCKDKYFSLLRDQKYDDYWGVIDKHTKVRLSSNFKNLVEQMLSADPRQRPTVEQLSRHQWISSIQDQKVAQQSIIDMISEKRGVHGDNLSTQDSNSSDITCQ